MRTILVLTDFTERSKLAAEYALHLAADYKANLLLFNAFYVPVMAGVDGGAYPAYYGQYEEFEKESIENIKSLKDHLENAKMRFKIHAPEIQFQNKMGNLADGLQGMLNDNKIWMIVMGNKSKDSFFSRLMFGSESYQVLKTASCPVLMINEEAVFSPFRRLTLAVDTFSSETKKNIDFLVELASAYSAEIIIVHVSPESVEYEDKQQRLIKFHSIQSDINYQQIRYHEVIDEGMPDSLVHFSEHMNSDIIAVVHEKHGFFHESITKSMMRYHTIPLLIFPQLLAGKNSD